LTQEELNRMWVLRKVLATMGVVEAMELLQGKLSEAKSNADFLRSMNT
jgi:transcription termination factor Rho